VHYRYYLLAFIFTAPPALSCACTETHASTSRQNTAEMLLSNRCLVRGNNWVMTGHFGGGEATTYELTAIQIKQSMIKKTNKSHNVTAFCRYLKIYSAVLEIGIWKKGDPTTIIPEPTFKTENLMAFNHWNLLKQHIRSIKSALMKISFLGLTKQLQEYNKLKEQALPNHYSFVTNTHCGVKLRGLSPWANHTDRETAACRRS
jgi:hypothetical protein